METNDWWWGLAPLAAWWGATCGWHRRLKSWSEAALAGAVTLGLITVILTEILSALTMLKSGPVRGLWSGLALLGLIGWRTPRLPRGLIFLAILPLITLVAALVSPPNNNDSLTYHMTRVAMWAQQASVRHYPTPDLRQIYHQPMAEYALLQLQLLSGGDALANLVQWGSGLGCALAVWVLTRQLGGGARTQTLAVLLAQSVPMVVLQSSSTQNDLVTSLWFLSVLVFGQRSLGSAAAALAILTKGTMLIALAPFLLVLPRRRWLLFGGMILALNGPFWARNLALCGDPLALSSPGMVGVRTSSMTPTLWLLNGIRNGALHVSVPGEIEGVTQALRQLHQALNVDPEDPRFTHPGCRFAAQGWRHHEDTVGDGPGLGLILVSLVWAGVRRPGRLRLYAAQLVAASALFCLLLTWNPWLTRLQLPMFLGALPLAALFLERFPWSPTLVAVHYLLGLYTALWNDNRPLLAERLGGHWNLFSLTRPQRYFTGCAWEEPTFEQMLEQLRKLHPTRLGLASEGRSYLYFALTSGIQIEYVHAGFEPEVVAAYRLPGRLRLEGRNYARVWELDGYQLFTPAP